MQNRKHISIHAMFDLEKFEKSSQTMQRKMRMAASQLKSVGQNMSLAVSAPIVASIGYATNEFAKFEQSMAKVNAVSGATSSEMGKLTDLAQDLGISTRYTASQVSDLELNYAKLGFSPKLIQEITESTLDLALATGGDLADSAMVAGATLRGFGLEGNEMQRVVDVMAKSFTSSALDLEKFSVSISKIAPIAAVTGRTIEEVAAQQSVLADTGVEASIIGTSLRKIYGDLAKSGMSYSEAMDRIRNSTNKVAVATELFDIRAANAAIILSEQEDKVVSLTESYKNSAGEAKRMADIMNDTLQMSVIRLKSAIEGLAISFGEMIAPRIRGIADFMADLSRYFAELTPNVKRAIITFASLLAVGGPVLIALGSISLAVTAVGSTLAATAVGVTVLVAAFGGLVSYFNRIPKLTEDFIKLQTRAERNSEFVTNSVKEQTDAFNKLYVKLKFTTSGTDERRKALEKINSTHGTHLKDIKDEKDWLDQLTIAYSEVVSQMEARAIASMNQGRMDELVIDREGILESIENEKRILQSLAGKDDLPAVRQAEKYLGMLREGLSKVNAEIAAINEEVKDVVGTNLAGGGTSPLKGGDSKKKEKKNYFPGMTFVGINEFNDFLEGNRALKDFQEQALVTSTIVANGWSFMTEAMLSEFYKIPKVLTPVQQKLKDFTEDINESIQTMAQDVVYNMADMFGQMIASGDNFTSEDFGRGLLEMVAGFMQQLGGLMIAFGIQFSIFKESLTKGQALIALGAGIAMVAAGAAIKGTLASGLNGKGSVGTTSSPSSTSNSGARYSPHQSEEVVVVRGRELLLVQNRERNYRR